MTSLSPILEGLLNTKPLLARFLPGFDDSNHTRQAPNLPNHLAWNLGHLAITMGRAAERLAGTPPGSSGLPRGLFLENSDNGEPGPTGRFGTESVSFKSIPTDDPARYPSMQRCVEIFNTACDHLAHTARNADPARLDTLYPWGAIQISGHAMLLRMIYHNGTHTGQITDLRRALKMPRVLE